MPYLGNLIDLIVVLGVNRKREEGGVGWLAGLFWLVRWPGG